MKKVLNNYSSKNDVNIRQIVAYRNNILEIEEYKGGFNKEDNSYIIRLTNNKKTPAPWINVISNKNFGFNISESGGGYTWCGNSRENKITPWSNDYIKDTF